MSGPLQWLLIQNLLDALQAGLELRIVELAVHRVATTLEGHLTETLAVFHLQLGLGDGVQICIVVPEEATLEQILERLEHNSRVIETVRIDLVVIIVSGWARLARDAAVRANAEVLF